MAVETVAAVATEKGAWEQVVSEASRVKRLCNDWDTTLAVGGLSVEQIIYGLYRPMLGHMNKLDEHALVAGLDTYVQDLRDDGTYVATTQIAAVTAAIQLVLDWIDANASGLALTGDTAANALALGSIATDRFASGALSVLRTRVSDVDALIN